MKKAIIILAVILTSGLTALSVTKNDNKIALAGANIKKVRPANKDLGANTDNLATID
jgi:short subunit dehydrogenase-like uncharacterized protein